MKGKMRLVVDESIKSIKLKFRQIPQNTKQDLSHKGTTKLKD